jgi:Uma2 family endonuclease
MVTALSQSISLQEFLKLPETNPPNEYLNGKIIPKPMPKGRHSRLQGKLCTVINQVTEDSKIAYAFPELRCTFGESSIVPDIVVLRWQQIPFTEQGKVEDDFRLAPDWTIEILSPEQNPNKVIGNILYCLESGTQLGWFLDPNDQSILVFRTNRQPKLYQDSEILPVLDPINLQLTPSQIFAWLKMN